MKTEETVRTQMRVTQSDLKRIPLIAAKLKVAGGDILSLLTTYAFNGQQFVFSLTNEHPAPATEAFNFTVTTKIKEQLTLFCKENNLPLSRLISYIFCNLGDADIIKLASGTSKKLESEVLASRLKRANVNKLRQACGLADIEDAEAFDKLIEVMSVGEIVGYFKSNPALAVVINRDILTSHVITEVTPAIVSAVNSAVGNKLEEALRLFSSEIKMAQE